MLPEIRKILYATDLSENARHAFGYAVSLANRYGAGITIMHVLEDVQPFADSLVVNMLGEERWKELRKANEDQVLERLRGRLKDFCDEVSRELPSCPFITDEIIVKVGNPSEEILDQIASGGYDLVVLGAHGHGILGNALMGGVSRRVVRRSKTPVLVIRLPKE
ncbi:MAG: universal stress protein [Deltaproteobacteria bacterium]|nr:universal stress protein [Deltaproteobacteria bacterium]MBW1948459.1 universal stress protein [Deltaproteobacteria bacterium]